MPGWIDGPNRLELQYWDKDSQFEGKIRIDAVPNCMHAIVRLLMKTLSGLGNAYLRWVRLEAFATSQC